VIGDLLEKRLGAFEKSTLLEVQERACFCHHILDLARDADLVGMLCVCVCVREREREREREMERWCVCVCERERDMQRWREREREREYICICIYM